MSKLMSLAEAIQTFVSDGCHLALGGFVTSRKPYAAVHEILRQGIRHLVLEGGPAGGDVDMLIGAGRVKAYINYYIANSGYSNVCRMFRRAAEGGQLLIEDFSLDVYAQLMHAAALGLPYLPTRYLLGSDLAAKWGISAEQRREIPGLAQEKLRVTENPFAADEKLALIPTPQLDVCIIHAQSCSENGLVRIAGAKFSDIDLALAAKCCIVTCEQLVSDDELRRDPDANTLPPFAVDAVVHAPYGAHPAQVYGFYDYDRDYLLLYDQVSRAEDSFDAFLQEWVYGTASHAGYLARLGEARLAALQIDREFGYVPAGETHA